MLMTPRKVGVWAGVALVVLLTVAAAQQHAKPRPANPKDEKPQGAKQTATAAPDNRKDDKKDDKKTPGSRSPKDTEAGDIDASQYVGTQACSDCHEDVGGTFGANPHHK